MDDFCMWWQFLFGKKYATYKLFRLNDCGKPYYGMDSQGIDVYNNRYIFQGSDQNGKLASLVVIDIVDKKIVGEFELDLPGCHMNNINIGGKLHSDSTFPLLYISECKNGHKCYVVNIENDLSKVSIVQTITFNSGVHYGKFKNAFDWFLCGECIYTFGMTGSDGEIEIIKFPKPNINETNVIYGDKHIVSSFKLQNCYIYQGTKVIGGKLYALFGWDTKDYPAYLKIINLRNGVVEDTVNIKGLGELEGLGQYKDGIIVSNNALNPTYNYVKLKNS